MDYIYGGEAIYDSIKEEIVDVCEMVRDSLLASGVEIDKKNLQFGVDIDDIWPIMDGEYVEPKTYTGTAEISDGRMEDFTFSFYYVISIDREYHSASHDYVEVYNGHLYEVDMEDALEKAAEKNPMFATTELFKEFASGQLKAKYPEAGVDFGFFSVRESRVMRFRDFIR